MSKEYFVSKSNTKPNNKDLWQTPRELFNALNNEFDFTVDVCASKSNSLCFRYYSEENSALESEWRDGAHFINPPYSQTEEFLLYSANQAKKNNTDVVALVNANTDTKWFSNAVKTANEIRLISGRISFIQPGGEKASGNTKGQCLIIWRGKCETPCNIVLVSRNDLLTTKE